MEQVFLKLLNMSLTACWLILAVMLLRPLLRRAPKWSRCVMWAVVGLRLVCPFTVESALSLIPTAEKLPVEVAYAGEGAAQSGVSFADGTATVILPQVLAPTPMYSADPMQVVAAVAAVVWLAGAAGMLIYMAFSFARVKRRVREAARMEDNVYLCDRVGSPFILGVLRPRIYLPSAIRQEDIPHVLSHERAHLQRRDHWWKPLGFLILTAHWFNPLVWAAYILLCRDIELACDEKVIRELGDGEKKPYSTALINCAAPRRAITACPLAFGEVGVKGRVKSVLSYKKPVFWVICLAVAVCAVLSVCFLTDPKTEDPRLEQYLREQILQQNRGKNDGDLICCVDYELLGRQKSDGRDVLYLCVYCAKYDPVTGENVGGSHTPTAITVEGSGGTYGVYEYWTPRDGSAYAASIREKFPFYLWSRALDTERCLEEHRESCQRQLRVYTADQAALAELRKNYSEYFDLNASKGLDVYVWQMAANSYYFALFPHTGVQRDMSELMLAAGTQADEMRLILSTYDVDEDEISVIPYQNLLSSYIAEYWIINEGEDLQAKREQYVQRLRDMLFGDAAAEQSADTDRGGWFVITQDGATAYAAAVIDTAAADMDGDGISEEWTLSYGPASGLYTVCISMAEDGRRQYFNIVMPSYTVEGFEKTQDGTLWIRCEGEEHGPAPRIDIRLEGEDIVLTENGSQQVPYWGEQGLQSPYNYGWQAS